MKLVIITGPPAVGKMTIGQELEKITELKLFHNHMSIEVVVKFFDFGTEEFDRLDQKIRFEIFKEIAKSDIKGLIFTIVWAFNLSEDREYVDEIIEIFAERKPEVYFVELTADLNIRLERNKHPHRLEHKATKRNMEMSEKSLLSYDKEFRMHTEPNEFPDKQFYKIDNTNLSPEEVASLIKNKFDL